MASRPAWFIRNNMVKSQMFTFEWFPGFSTQQSQRSIRSLHGAIHGCGFQNILECSTKSESEIGQQLSAFNLSYDTYKLENVFQSAKIYADGQTHYELLRIPPFEAKRSAIHKNSGRLCGFKAYDSDFLWPLTPQTAFYDYLYLKSLFENEDLLKQIVNYEAFTDIAFNPEKSINCQARSVAVAKLVYLNEMHEVMKNPEEWLAFHMQYVKG